MLNKPFYDLTRPLHHDLFQKVKITYVIALIMHASLSNVCHVRIHEILLGMLTGCWLHRPNLELTFIEIVWDLNLLLLRPIGVIESWMVRLLMLLLGIMNWMIRIVMPVKPLFFFCCWLDFLIQIGRHHFARCFGVSMALSFKRIYTMIGSALASEKSRKRGYLTFLCYVNKATDVRLRGSMSNVKSYHFVPKNRLHV